MIDLIIYCDSVITNNKDKLISVSIGSFIDQNNVLDTNNSSDNSDNFSSKCNLIFL